MDGSLTDQMGGFVACYTSHRRYWSRSQCLAVSYFPQRGSPELMSPSPQDALLHCLKLTKPDMVLVDEERVELFAEMSKDLGGIKMYCWSELRGSRAGSSI
jgi:hypothetical protein